MIVNDAFYPANVTVPKGTTVTWINIDFVSHTVTSGSEQAPPESVSIPTEFSHMQTSITHLQLGRLPLNFWDVHPR